jgi:hypothetical protein
MARSEEKRPTPAVLMIDIRVHSIALANASPILRRSRLHKISRWLTLASFTTLREAQ